MSPWRRGILCRRNNIASFGPTDAERREVIIRMAECGIASTVFLGGETDIIVLKDMY